MFVSIVSTSPAVICVFFSGIYWFCTQREHSLHKPSFSAYASETWFGRWLMSLFDCGKRLNQLLLCFQMGQLVFQRLFYHHMAGQLQGHSDFKNRLFTYTDGQLSLFFFFLSVVLSFFLSACLSSFLLSFFFFSFYWLAQKKKRKKLLFALELRERERKGEREREEEKNKMLSSKFFKSVVERYFSGFHL